MNMSRLEFGSVIAYLVELWPGFALNNEQGELWYRALAPHDVQLCRRAAAAVYQAGRQRDPTLSDLREKLRTMAPATVEPSRTTQTDAQYRAQALREDQEDIDALAQYQPADLEASKNFILAQEPELRAALGDLPANSGMWRRLIVSRLVEKLVPTFPNGGDCVLVPVGDWWDRPRVLGPMGLELQKPPISQ